MNLFDKFLLALVLLILLALSLFAGGVAVGLISLESVGTIIGNLGTVWNVNAFIIGGAALLLVIIVLRLFAASYGGRGMAYTRLAVTENGEISISIPTIRQIAAAFIANKVEIAASSSEILPTKFGLYVNLRICVKEGSVLPEVTEAVQKELKTHLETVTGLVIKQVRVSVDNNRSNYSGKGR
jgi:hypothetical protein